MKLAKNGFNATELSNAIAAVDALSKQESAKAGAEGAAKGATGDRTTAFAALQAWVSKFRKLAKVALKNHPEHLAALKL